MQNLCFFGILTFSLPHPRNERLEPKNQLLLYKRTFRLACNPSLHLTVHRSCKTSEAITAEKQARQNLIQRTFETCTSIAHHNWGVNLYWAKSCQSRVFVDINGINHPVKALEAQSACPYLPQELPPSEPEYHICFISPATLFFRDSPHFLPFGISCVSRPWQLRSHVTVLEPEVKQTKFVKISLPNLKKSWRKHQNSQFKGRNH